MQTKKDQLDFPVHRSGWGLNPRSQSDFLESGALQSVTWVLFFALDSCNTYGFISEDISQGEISSHHVVVL